MSHPWKNSVQSSVCHILNRLTIKFPVPEIPILHKTLILICKQKWFKKERHKEAENVHVLNDGLEKYKIIDQLKR